VKKKKEKKTKNVLPYIKYSTSHNKHSIPQVMKKKEIYYRPTIKTFII